MWLRFKARLGGGWLRIEVSHPCRKNKNAARMGHPPFEVKLGAKFDVASESRLPR